MYSFNQGGTMTESSNYDASPPVPPAYGIWRKVGAREYEAKYEFYVTTAPKDFDAIAKGGGWGLGGPRRVRRADHGVRGRQVVHVEDQVRSVRYGGEAGRGWWGGDGEGCEAGVLASSRNAPVGDARDFPSQSPRVVSAGYRTRYRRVYWKAVGHGSVRRPPMARSLRCSHFDSARQCLAGRCGRPGSRSSRAAAARRAAGPPGSRASPSAQPGQAGRRALA